MRCNNYLLLYTLLGSLSVLVVSSAPSEKRTRDLKQATKSDDGKLKQLLQAEPIPKTRNTDSDESQWYPTIDLTDNDESDYPEAEQKAKSNQEAKDETQPKTKSQAGTSNFKTFCEDGSKSGDCKEKSENADGEQNLNGLVGKIQEIVGKQDSIDKNEVTHLRKLVGILAEKVHELQQRCVDNGAESTKVSSKSSISKSKGNRARAQGPIAEIEETHIVERKILKAKDRQDNKQMTSETQTIVETAGNKIPTAKVDSSTATKNLARSSTIPPRSLPPASPIPPAVPLSPSSLASPIPPSSPSSPVSPSSPSSPLSPSSPSSPLSPSSPSPSSSATNLEQNSRVESSKIVEQTKSSQTSSGTGEINYLDGYPADVNFNGGFNQHMNVLKQRWPDGHWPDDGENSIDETGSSITKNEDSEEEEYYYDYEDEENEKEKGGRREKPDTDFKEYPTHSNLTPTFLEKLIQEEREISNNKDNNSMPLTHHVQEHKLPAKRSKV